MKKVFLMLAFTGLVASVSASTTDDKDKGKKETKKEAKSCCKDKSATAGKSCSASDKKEGKACCKEKKAPETKSTEVK